MIYHYYYVVSKTKRFLIRIESARGDPPFYRATEKAKNLVGSLDFEIKLAYLRDFFDFENDVVDLTSLKQGNQMYYYFFVRALGQPNFLVRVDISGDVFAQATEIAELHTGTKNFKIEEATLENIFGFEFNVVTLTPVIVQPNKGN